MGALDRAVADLVRLMRPVPELPAPEAPVDRELVGLRTLSEWLSGSTTVVYMYLTDRQT